LQKCRCGLQNQDTICAAGLEQFDAVGRRGQDRLELFRAEELKRVWIEGQGNGRPADRPGLAAHFA
jgi:hypothetical protein